MAIGFASRSAAQISRMKLFQSTTVFLLISNSCLQNSTVVSSFRNPTSLQESPNAHRHLSPLSRRSNVTGFPHVPQFLGLCKTPLCCKKATLAALLFMMFESSSKFIATKLNRHNNLVNNCEVFTFFSKIIDQKRYSNVDEHRVRNIASETSCSKHREN